ncbi:MAG: hypothetical protein ABH839_01720 [Chloroflexota bacterium]
MSLTAPGGHTAIDNAYDAGEYDAYIWAHGLDTSTTYDVAYYDAGANGGRKIETDGGLTATTYGNISSTLDLTGDGSAVAGTWHAAVFRLNSNPPTNYDSAAGTDGFVTADSFDVDAAAIPEFPAVIAGVGVAGLMLRRILLDKEEKTGACPSLESYTS